MSLLYQNDPRLSELIAGNGCELLCSIAIPCLHVNRFLSPHEVLLLTEYCISRHMIGFDLSLCHETSPRAVMHETFRSLGIVDVQGYQVGSIVEGVVSWWKWYEDSIFNYAILRGTTYHGSPHSVLLDRDLQEIYNPYPTKSIAKRGPMYLYRILRAEDCRVSDGE